MGRVDGYRAALRALARSKWPTYLAAHSGLPGPRGNIELAQAVAEEADPEFLDALIATGDEYLVFCGVVGLGRLLAEGAGRAVEQRLYTYAVDERWRVREAVAMALQRLGDRDVRRLLDVVTEWADDSDPLVQRAAAAGVCEPRLLSTPEAATVAIAVCNRITRRLADRPAGERHDPECAHCAKASATAGALLWLPTLIVGCPHSASCPIARIPMLCGSSARTARRPGSPDSSDSVRVGRLDTPCSGRACPASGLEARSRAAASRLAGWHARQARQQVPQTGHRHHGPSVPVFTWR